MSKFQQKHWENTDDKSLKTFYDLELDPFFVEH